MRCEKMQLKRQELILRDTMRLLEKLAVVSGENVILLVGRQFNIYHSIGYTFIP